MHNLVDLTGRTFGELYVIGRTEKKGMPVYWDCQCSCGNIKSVAAKHLKSGGTKSCGCKQHIRSHYIHGMTGTKLYQTRIHMLERCNNPKDKRYKNYGGRGIKVCEEWSKSFTSFRDWALANGYKEGLSIDRIDVNGNYEPSNCRWITMAEQANNTTRSVYITHNGETLTKADWVRKIGINYSTFSLRYLKYGNDDRIFQKKMK